MKINLKDLHRGDVIAGICAAVVACAVVALFASALLGLGAGVLFGYIASVARHRYMAALQARVERSDGPVWDVELNGVKVGTISDSNYAAVRLQVFGDGRLYAAQLMNCGRVLLRVLDSMLMVAPVLVFWGLLAVAIVSPGSLTEVLNELRTATPAGIASLASLLLTAMMTVGLLSAGLSAALTGARFGFANRFREETTRMLRRLLCVAAEGDVVLVRWVDGARQINDERSALTTGA